MDQHVLHFLVEVQASFDVTSLVMSTYNKESSESFEAIVCRLLKLGQQRFSVSEIAAENRSKSLFRMVK